MVVEEKNIIFFSHTCTQKQQIPIYERKKPKNAYQGSEEKHHGVKNIFDQQKKSKCASRMHLKAKGTHNKEPLENTKNIKNA